jgi:hypothetical protein
MLRRRPVVPFLEIILLVLPPLAIMWVTPLLIPRRTDRYFLDLSLTVATLLVAVLLNILHGEGPAHLGFRLTNFPEALRSVLAFTLAASLVLLAIAALYGRHPFDAAFVPEMAALTVWALMQQYGMQGVINRRWQMVLGKGARSTWLTAATFSALHAPNPALVVFTLVAGYFWAKSFQAAPNLFAIAVSHAWLSLLVSNSCPPAMLPNMKVGLGFW